jgi:hypothetical protein
VLGVRFSSRRSMGECDQSGKSEAARRLSNGGLPRGIGTEPNQPGRCNRKLARAESSPAVCDSWGETGSQRDTDYEIPTSILLKPAGGPGRI